MKFPNAHLKLKDFILELGRFGIVGALRTIIGLLIIFIPYNFFGINYLLCNIVAYIVGLLIGFILHKRWVFKSIGDWKEETFPYLATFAIAFIINMLLLVLFAEIIIINKNISQIIALFGFTSTSYLLNKFWTFNKETI